MQRKKSLLSKLFLGIAILLIGMVAGFFFYVSSSYEASTLANDSIQTAEQVKVKENGDIVFEPVGNDENIGFIFYPGAKVEPAAYAPMAKEIASKGYTVVIPKMTFNFAIFSPDRADDIISQYKDIDTWVIGGHSLGGVMASDYALKNEEIKGLILLASYPQDKTDLSDTGIKVLSLWGSNDQVADLTKVKEAKRLMPEDAIFTEIAGGNHGGFGDYGHQKGDGTATISNEQQINETSAYIVDFLSGIQK